MTTPTRLVICSVVTFALAMPSLAGAQVRARGGDDGGSSGGSSSGGSSSGGSSSGGSSSSGSSDSGGSSTPSRVPMPDAPRSGGYAVPRGERAQPPSTPSGNRDSGSSGVSGNGERTGVNDGASPRVNPDRVNGNGGRIRGNEPTVGYAARRTSPRPGDRDVVVLGGGGDWYPWYGSGLNWYYTPYRSYRYGSSNWIWGRYGLWSDPFYDPYGYSSPGLYTPGYGMNAYVNDYGGPSSSFEEAPREATGSVRVRVSPRHANVFLDGVMMGTVDDFDGLTSHLSTKAGAHNVEIRADGYAPLTLPVNVEDDKTVTVRGSLKKN